MKNFVQILYKENSALQIIELTGTNPFTLKMLDRPYLIVKAFINNAPVIFDEMTNQEKLICSSEFYDLQAIDVFDYFPEGIQRTFAPAQVVTVKTAGSTGSGGSVTFPSLIALDQDGDGFADPLATSDNQNLIHGTLVTLNNTVSDIKTFEANIMSNSRTVNRVQKLQINNLNPGSFSTQDGDLLHSVFIEPENPEAQFYVTINTAATEIFKTRWNGNFLLFDFGRPIRLLANHNLSLTTDKTGSMVNVYLYMSTNTSNL